MAAKDHFTANSAHDVWNAFAPGLQQDVHATSGAISLIFLLLFLPASVSISDLPHGIESFSFLLRVWSLADNTPDASSIFALLTTRLLSNTKCLPQDETALPHSTLAFLTQQCFATLTRTSGPRPHKSSQPLPSSISHLGLPAQMHDVAAELLMVSVNHPVFEDAGDTAYGDGEAADKAISNSSIPEDSSEKLDIEQATTGSGDAIGGIVRFLRTVETLCHPHNSGANKSVAQFVIELVHKLAERVGAESGARAACAAAAAALGGSPGQFVDQVASRKLVVLEVDRHITPLQTHVLLNALLPLLKYLTFASDGRIASSALAAWTQVAGIAPRRITGEVVQLVQESLDPAATSASVSVHRTPAALKLLAAVARPLLYPRPWLAAHLPRLVSFALGTLDAADPKKAEVCLSLLATVLGCVPAVDPSDSKPLASESKPVGPGAVDDEVATLEVIAQHLPAEHPDRAAMLHAAGQHTLAESATALAAVLSDKSNWQVYALAGGESYRAPLWTSCPVPLVFDELRLASPLGDGGALQAAGSKQTGTLPVTSVPGEEAWDTTLGAVPLSEQSVDTLVQLYQATHRAAQEIAAMASSLPEKLLQVLERLETTDRNKNMALGLGPEQLMSMASMYGAAMASLFADRAAPSRGASHLTGGGSGLGPWSAWHAASGSSVGSALESVFHVLFSHSGQLVRSAALSTVAAWAEAAPSSLKCQKFAARVLAAAVLPHPETALKVILPGLLQRAEDSTLTDADKEWALTLASGVVRNGHSALLPHLPAIEAAVTAGLSSESVEVFSAALRLLRHTLHSLVFFSLKAGDDARSVGASRWAAGHLWCVWGVTRSPKDTASEDSFDIDWYEPRAAELSAAAGIVSRFGLSTAAALAAEVSENAAGAFADAEDGVQDLLDPAHAANSAVLSAVKTGAAAAAAGSGSKSEEQKRLVQLMCIVFRGATPLFTDGSSDQGDDNVIVYGTRRTSEVTAVVGHARSAFAWVANAMLSMLYEGVALSGTTDGTRDADLVSKVQELAQRLVTQRGLRKGKVKSWLGHLGANVGNDTVLTVLYAANARYFKAQTMVQDAAGHKGVGPASVQSSASQRDSCTVYSRQLLACLAQLQHGRRQGAAVWAVLTHLHHSDAGEEGALSVPDDMEEDGNESEQPPAKQLQLPLSDTALASPTAVVEHLTSLKVVAGRSSLSTVSRREVVYYALLLQLVRGGAHTYDSVTATSLTNGFVVRSILPWAGKAVEQFSVSLANASMQQLRELPPQSEEGTSEADTAQSKQRQKLWQYMRCAFLPLAVPSAVFRRAAYNSSMRLDMASLLKQIEPTLPHVPKDKLSSALALVITALELYLSTWTAPASVAALPAYAQGPHAKELQQRALAINQQARTVQDKLSTILLEQLAPESAEPPQVPGLDGTKSASAAPAAPSSSMHWRFQLISSALLATLWVPPPSEPAALSPHGSAGLVAGRMQHERESLSPENACCASLKTVGDGQSGAISSALSAEAAEAWCPPDKVWCWWAAAALSDSVPLRTLGFRNLSNLLYTLARGRVGEGTNATSTWATVGEAMPDQLTAVLSRRAPKFLAALQSTVFLEQLLAAQVSERPAAHGGKGGHGGKKGPASAMSAGQWSAGIASMSDVVHPAYAQVGGPEVSSSEFQHAHGQLWSSLYRVLGSSLLDTVVGPMKALVDTPRDHTDASLRLAVVNEVWAGIVAACVDVATGSGGAIATKLAGAPASPREELLAFVFKGVQEQGSDPSAFPLEASAVFSDAAATAEKLKGEVGLQDQARVLAWVLPAIDASGLERLGGLLAATCFAAHLASPAQVAPLLAILLAKAAVGLSSAPSASGSSGNESFGAMIKWLRMLDVALFQSMQTQSVGVNVLPQDAKSGVSQQVSVACLHHYLPGSLSRLPRFARPGLSLDISAWGDSPGAEAVGSVGGVLSARTQGSYVLRRLLWSLLPHLAHPFTGAREAIAQTIFHQLGMCFSVGDAVLSSQPSEQWGKCPSTVALPVWGPVFMQALTDTVSRIASGEDASSSSEARPDAGAAAGGLASTELERAMRSVAILAKGAASTSGDLSVALLLPLLRPLLLNNHFKDDEVTKFVAGVSASVAVNLNLHRLHAADVANDTSLLQGAATPGSPQDTWRAVLALLGDMLNEESWHTRVAALKVVSSLRSGGFIGASYEVDSALVELITKRLGDRQLEVQQAAGNALAAVAVSMSAASAHALLERMRPHIMASVPARPAASASAAAKAKFAKCVRRRLAGCLGAAALVRSHPYTVPSYVPDALSLLGRCASDGAPVGKIVQEVVTSFRSTHADEWDSVHKHAFTPEQLSEVRDMLVSPHYFA